MATVFAQQSGIGQDPDGRGGVVYYTENEVWDGDDPFVKANRHLFAADPTRVRRTQPPAEQPPARVERGTRRPGEVRG